MLAGEDVTEAALTQARSIKNKQRAETLVFRSPLEKWRL